MTLETRRLLVLVAGILANVCQGAAYASSVFAKPMLTHLSLLVPKMIPGPDGARIPDPSGAMVPDMTVWAMAFSINLGCLPLGMLLSGRIADRRSPRIVIAGGGLLFAIGMLLNGFVQTQAQFFATFGVMMGLGSGAAYGAVVATSVRWFPDKRGLASGLVVGALGLGSFLIAPIADWLIRTRPLPQEGVLFAFQVLGSVFIVLFVLAAWMVAPPPADFVPKGFKPTAAQAASGGFMAWQHMVRTGRFWLLYGMYACGAFSGLMVISQASPIAQMMASDIKALGDPVQIAAAGAVVASLLGLANGFGRILWGAASDRIGRPMALLLMFVLTAIAMFLLPVTATMRLTLTATFIVIGLCFGGYLGTFPSLCADAFGARALAVNYGLLFSAFSVAAIAGPQVGAAILKATGSYNQAFVVAGVVCLVGIVLSVIFIWQSRKDHKHVAV